MIRCASTLKNRDVKDISAVLVFYNKFIPTELHSKMIEKTLPSPRRSVATRYRGGIAQAPTTVPGEGSYFPQRPFLPRPPARRGRAPSYVPPPHPSHTIPLRFVHIRAFFSLHFHARLAPQTFVLTAALLSFYLRYCPSRLSTAVKEYY